MSKRTQDGCRRLAAEHLARQVRALRAQLPGVRKGKDPECVHQARVACRRMRVGLRMFKGSYPAPRRRKWKRAVKAFTTALGPVRDLDVHATFVQGVVDGLGDEQNPIRPGIERLLLRIRQQRSAAQPGVVEAVRTLRASGALQDAAAWCRGARRRAAGDAEVCRRHTVEPILAKARALRAHAPCLAEPKAAAEHHQMRIAAKRLRYAMEITRELHGGRLDEFVKAVKKLQTLLGDVHDCDVWVAVLDEFTREECQRTECYFGEPEPFDQYRPGLEYLRRQRLEDRRSAFAKAEEHWRRIEKRGFWGDLERAVRSPNCNAGCDCPAPVEGAGE